MWCFFFSFWARRGNHSSDTDIQRIETKLKVSCADWQVFSFLCFFAFCYFSLFFRTFCCLFGLSNQQTQRSNTESNHQSIKCWWPNCSALKEERQKITTGHIIVKPGLYKTQRTRMASYGIRLERLCTV